MPREAIMKPTGQRATEPRTDTDMIRWIALYVITLSSIESKKGECIELEANDEDGESVLVTRTAPTHLAALRACVREGMKQIPLQKP